jgi:predicted dehydrogenase
MKVAIIGAGLQCRRRAPVVRDSKDDHLVVISSLHREHAQEMASGMGCEASDDWQSAVARDDVDAVLICTPPHVHAEIGIAAMRAGKHVLCEKPMTRTVAEAEQLVRVSQETGMTLKCGFNHRHHPAIWEARKLLAQGTIGKPLFARCVYGICGRPGYENEWRADPAQAAGGQFIEQGTHAIDLFRWFLGEVAEVACMTGVRFFEKQTMDDNAMAIFRMTSGAMASVHSSLTQWKNLFCFEVFGETGYLGIEGLGASYGTEKLTVAPRDFSAPFQETITEFRGGDISWREEWKEFKQAIAERREPIGSGSDGLVAMRIALAAYQSEHTKSFAAISERGIAS